MSRPQMSVRKSPSANVRPQVFVRKCPVRKSHTAGPLIFPSNTMN
jgi:hypothetical protein